MRKTIIELAIVGAALGLGGSCGGGETAVPEASRSLPACAGAGAPVPRAGGLPAGFPLPPGTIVTSSQDPAPGQLLIGGVVPTDLRSAASHFIEKLPAAGYRLGEGDAEQDEAEAPFAGHGFRGKWKVRGILDCPSAVTLTLVLVKER
jgi:hypothetical protein